MVREPIARNVSAFFEVLEFYLEGNDVNNITIQELYDIYQEKLPHNYPLVWFDNEIKKYLDIDIYSYPYELYKKYIHINRGSIDLLVLRTDAVEGDKLEALSSITKMEIKAIPRLNVSDKKYYSKKYDQFVSQAFPLEYINQMLDSTYAKHFYTSSELTTLRKKWAQCLSN